MFCPLEVDYGNAADWIAGIGSLAAVGVALYIANGQERFAQRQRQEAKNEEYERKVHLIMEVVRLTAEIESHMTSTSNLIDAGGGGAGGWMNTLDEIEGIRTQLTALQPLAQSDPRIFGEIGRILRESDTPNDFRGANTSYVSIIYRGIVKRLAERRTTLAKLP